MGLISVIIPCYNGSVFIENCLDSLEQQSSGEFEVIIIDDCSTDNTVDVFDSIRKKYHFPIKFLRNKENSGPSYSRKIGAKKSSNPYLAFCDVDDIFTECFVEEVSKSIMNNNPDMVIFGYNMILPNGIKRPHRFTQTDILVASKEQLFLTGINSLWNIVIKKELFLSVEHPDLRNGEDMAVIPLFLAKANIANILSSALYNYVSRPNSISNTSNMKVVKSLLASYNHVRHYMPKGLEVFEEYIGVSRVLYGTILNLFKIGYNRKEAIEIANTFTNYYPNWRSNRYIKELPLTRKIFVWFIGHNLTLMPWLMTKIHTLMIR